MDFTLENNESIVLEVKGTHIRSFWDVIQGTFYLTNQRVVFARPCKAVRFWAPMAEGFVKGVDVSFAHFYTDISSATIKKHGFAKKIALSCKSGVSYEVQATKLDEFMATLRNHISANGGNVVEDGAGGFTVA